MYFLPYVSLKYRNRRQADWIENWVLFNSLFFFSLSFFSSFYFNSCGSKRNSCLCVVYSIGTCIYVFLLQNKKKTKKKLIWVYEFNKSMFECSLFVRGRHKIDFEAEILTWRWDLEFLSLNIDFVVSNLLFNSFSCKRI